MKRKIYQIVLLISFTLTMVLKFVITFNKGMAGSSPINKGSLDLMILGCILSIILFLFGTTVSREKKMVRIILCTFGLLSLVVYLSTIFVVVLN